MLKLFSVTRVRYLTVFWGSVIIAGLFLTRWVLVLPSIGMAGLFITSVGYALGHGRVGQRNNWQLPLSFTLVYSVHVMGAMWHGAGPAGSLQKDLVLQLPFLVLPLAFWLLPDWQVPQKNCLWLVLIGCCLLSGISATTNYLQHARTFTILYGQSQVMPTEPDYPRFSLLITMAVLWALLYLLERKGPKWLRLAVAATALLLILFQHLLAARSGLLSLYAVGLLLAIWVGHQLKQWKKAVISILLAAGLGTVCLILMPTLRMRVVNTFYDAEQASRSEAANNFSVTARLYSYEIAQAIIKNHIWLGVGKVQLPAEMATQYSYRYPKINPDKYVLPHNQFLYNLAAYGIIGLWVFIAGYYYALGKAIRKRNVLAIGIYLILSLSFLSEYTLETNIGVIVGLFFPLLASAPEPACGSGA